MIEFTHILRWPWAAAGAAFVLAVLWLSYRQAKGRPPKPLQAALIALRAAAIALVTLCLLDPQWVEIIKHEKKTRMAVMLDKSQSMSIRDIPNGRFNTAREWIKNEVLPSVPSGVTLSAYVFDHGLSSPPALDASSPTGGVTALADSLESLLSAPADDPLAGVILISDGIENYNRAPERVAKLYRRKGIPIHTVTVGTTNDMKDIILENVQVKRSVQNEAPTRVGLTLRSFGYDGSTVSVQLRNRNGIVAADEIKLTGGTQKVEIDLTPRQKGFQVYEAVVAPQTGEWLSSNNRRQFGFEVVDPTLRVVYMEGTPQENGSPMPEWKYLKDALESDPNIKVKVLYRKTGNNGQNLNTITVDPETGVRAYPVEHPIQGFPRTMAALLEYDVVIHSDIKKESFSAEQLQSMARLVEEHGGGFVMIGGNSAFGKGGYHRTVLDKIIPVAMERENDSDSAELKMLMTRHALTHPVMNIGATPQETELIWTAKFPWLYGYNRVDRAKPGATVLGYNPAYKNAFGQGVLLAVQEIGKGRSMAFMSDTTRTWGRDFQTLWGEPVNRNAALSERNCDSRYYQKFWVNAVRWLANGRMGRTNNNVVLELSQGYCLTNETVTARVKVRDNDRSELSNAEVSLVLSIGGKTNAPVRARYDAASRSYLAELKPGGEGSFIVTALAQRGGAKVGDDRQLLVSEAQDVEMSDLRARPDFMASLARDTGGDTFSVTNSRGASPAYVFTDTPPPTVEYRRKPFWDKALWMSLILGLLGAEWMLRRARGLA